MSHGGMAEYGIVKSCRVNSNVPKYALIIGLVTETVTYNP